MKWSGLVKKNENLINIIICCYVEKIEDLREIRFYRKERSEIEEKKEGYNM